MMNLRIELHYRRELRTSNPRTLPSRKKAVIDISDSPKKKKKRLAEASEPSSSKKQKVARKSETALKTIKLDDIDDIVDEIDLQASDDVRFPRSKDVRP